LQDDIEGRVRPKEVRRIAQTDIRSRGNDKAAFIALLRKAPPRLRHKAIIQINTSQIGALRAPRFKIGEPATDSTADVQNPFIMKGKESALLQEP